MDNKAIEKKTCVNCGEEFERRNWQRPGEWGRAKFCSIGCANKSRSLDWETFENRHVKKSSSGCWEWQSYLDVTGYGRAVKYGEVLTHRIFYRHYKGPITGGLHSLHLEGHNGGEMSMYRKHMTDDLLRAALRALAREMYQEYLRRNG